MLNVESCFYERKTKIFFSDNTLLIRYFIQQLNQFRINRCFVLFNDNRRRDVSIAFFHEEFIFIE